MAKGILILFAGEQRCWQDNFEESFCPSLINEFLFQTVSGDVMHAYTIIEYSFQN
jgi:hypothetical protein